LYFQLHVDFSGGSLVIYKEDRRFWTECSM